MTKLEQIKNKIFGIKVGKDEFNYSEKERIEDEKRTKEMDEKVVKDIPNLKDHLKFRKEHPLYYDKQSRPLNNVLQWGKMMEDRDYHRVRQQYVTCWKWKPVRYYVSTVWLGMDHGFGGKKPLIFETMIFGGGNYQDYQERYTTQEEALKRHKEIVKLVRWNKLEL